MPAGLTNRSFSFLTTSAQPGPAVAALAVTLAMDALASLSLPRAVSAMAIMIFACATSGLLAGATAST